MTRRRDGWERRPGFGGRLLSCLLATAVVAGACAGTAQTVSPGASATQGRTSSDAGVELAAAHLDLAPGSAEQAKTVADAIDAFGLTLFARATSGGGNAVVSPASVALALAMARAGARGETAAQMDAAMHSLGSDANGPGLAALDQVLSKVSGTFRDAEGDEHDVTLRIANAAFSQRGMQLTQAYLDALATRLGSGLHLVDYATGPEAARQLINAWVSEKTQQRIKELLAAGTIDPLTRLVLVNAIYLKAPWETPLPVEATKPAPFTLAGGRQIDVPTMNATLEASYAGAAGWQAVQLPYAGGSLAMLVIVPDDLASFEAGLDAARLGQIVDSLAPGQVQVALPRFKLETKVDLAGVLAAMGMPLAFDRGAADFSGITPDEQLYIDAVIHQANIDVDEKGTEAAAATAVVMRATGLPAEPKVLRADRPFLFALRELSTGTILFLGRVADPSQS